MIKFFTKFDENSLKLILSFYNNIPKNEKFYDEIKNIINFKQIDNASKYPTEIFRFFFDNKVYNLDIFYDKNGDYLELNINKEIQKTFEGRKSRNKISIILNMENSEKRFSQKNIFNKMSSKNIDLFHKSIIKEDKSKLEIIKLNEYRFYKKQDYKILNKSPIIKIFLNDTFLYYYNNNLRIFKLLFNKTRQNSKYDYKIKYELINNIDIESLYKNNYLLKTQDFYSINEKIYCFELWYRNLKKDLCLTIGSKRGFLIIFFHNPEKNNLFNYHFHLNLKHSISCIKNYRCSNIVVCGTIIGNLYLVDVENKIILKNITIHKGNITKIGFINLYDIIYTTSGSFSGNQDNSLNLIKLEILDKEVYLKILKRICNLHGKKKGIINAISTNKENDYLIYTTGSYENKKIFVIDGKNLTKIHTINLECSGYYMNIVTGLFLNNMVNDVFFNVIFKNKEESLKESDKLRLLIISGIKEVIIILVVIDLKNNFKVHSYLSKKTLYNENGSYFRTIQLFYLPNSNGVSVFCGNIKGIVEHFLIK